MVRGVPSTLSIFKNCSTSVRSACSLSSSRCRQAEKVGTTSSHVRSTCVPFLLMTHDSFRPAWVVRHRRKCGWRPFVYDVLGHTGQVYATPAAPRFAGHQWWSKLVAKEETGPSAHNATACIVRTTRQTAHHRDQSQDATGQTLKGAQSRALPPASRSVARCDTAAGRLRLFSDLVPAGRGASCCLKTSPSKE